MGGGWGWGQNGDHDCLLQSYILSLMLIKQVCVFFPLVHSCSYSSAACFGDLKKKIIM